MTSPVDRLLEVARSQLGYVELGGADGHSGNVTKFWAELDMPLQTQSWCAAYVSWCFKHAGLSLPSMDRPYGYMNCASAFAWAKRHNCLVSTPMVGDIVLYGKNGGTHTGIVEKVSRNGQDFMAIEGNTSPGPGLNPNGGMVAEKARNVKVYVAGFLRPDWAAWDKAPATPKENAPMFSPAVTINSPIVADAGCPTGGAWTLSEDGSIRAWGGAPYVGAANGKPYFVGRKATHFAPLTDADRAAGKLYVILSQNPGERYAYPE